MKPFNRFHHRLYYRDKTGRIMAMVCVDDEERRTMIEDLTSKNFEPLGATHQGVFTNYGTDYMKNAKGNEHSPTR